MAASCAMTSCTCVGTTQHSDSKTLGRTLLAFDHGPQRLGDVLRVEVLHRQRLCPAQRVEDIEEDPAGVCHSPQRIGGLPRVDLSAATAQYCESKKPASSCRPRPWPAACCQRCPARWSPAPSPLLLSTASRRPRQVMAHSVKAMPRSLKSRTFVAVAQHREPKTSEGHHRLWPQPTV